MSPPLDEVESQGISPEEAFSILGNETRIAILQALWETPETAVSFSDLRDRVAVADSGNFNYHLNQLADHFVRQTESGYELREAGKQVIRAVLAGAINEDAVLEPVETTSQCPYCGATVEMRYREDKLTVRCTRCEGVVSGDFPPGTYLSFDFPPAGLKNRTPEEVLRTAHTLYDAKITPMMEGVCPECAGRTSVSITVCDDHDVSDGHVCRNCDSVNEIWATYECEHCGYTRTCLVWFKLMNHPAVISFYYEYGNIQESVPFRKLTWENRPYVKDISETVLSEDPLRIQVTIPFQGETLHVTVDDAINVVDVRE